MPWVSDKQRRWGNSPAGAKAMGAAKVEEFNAATRGKKLKETASKPSNTKKK